MGRECDREENGRNEMMVETRLWWGNKTMLERKL